MHASRHPRNSAAVTRQLAAFCVFVADIEPQGRAPERLEAAIMRGLVEQLMPAAIDPGQFLTAINHSLHVILQQTEEPMLATAVYLNIDLAEHEIRFANAGHPSPIRISRDDQTAFPFRHYQCQSGSGAQCGSTSGPALGLFENSTYQVGRCPIQSNDMVILFTDGLYEPSDANGHEYGQERLLEFVRKRLVSVGDMVPVPKHLDAAHLFDDLLVEVRDWMGQSERPREFEDDVCLIGIEIQNLDWLKRFPP
jgi:sigma-B regulation protein RsbU (phosphoserine phosphatase)